MYSVEVTYLREHILKHKKLVVLFSSRLRCNVILHCLVENIQNLVLFLVKSSRNRDTNAFIGKKMEVSTQM